MGEGVSSSFWSLVVTLDWVLTPSHNCEEEATSHLSTQVEHCPAMLHAQLTCHVPCSFLSTLESNLKGYCCLHSARPTSCVELFHRQICPQARLPLIRTYCTRGLLSSMALQGGDDNEWKTFALQFLGPPHAFSSDFICMMSPFSLWLTLYWVFCRSD